ncbi:hypothetical protein AAES_182953 [Amazona aestiva]|uniref:Uncharacterized protein n=1 Tax=Amazona aestiva TaxID=12930 RepID=A0A0Q3X250_AMAAE|nr:hypothetical protein AAES_182953 [Amazona aestiva]
MGSLWTPDYYSTVFAAVCEIASMSGRNQAIQTQLLPTAFVVESDHVSGAIVCKDCGNLVVESGPKINPWMTRYLPMADAQDHFNIE